jgi:hypothetical protein
MTYMPSTLCLMNETITTAQTAALKTSIGNIQKAKSIALYCNFVYGSGGTSNDVYVQTSFDESLTWVDVANFHHTTSSLARCYNLTSVTPVTTVYTVTDGSLTNNTSKDGLLGRHWRVKFTSVGTYAGSTTLQVYAIAKD